VKWGKGWVRRNFLGSTQWRCRIHMVVNLNFGETNHCVSSLVCFYLLSLTIFGWYYWSAWLLVFECKNAMILLKTPTELLQVLLDLKLNFIYQGLGFLSDSDKSRSSGFWERELLFRCVRRAFFIFGDSEDFRIFGVSKIRIQKHRKLLINLFLRIDFYGSPVHPPLDNIKILSIV
jgi:hypothetical protein